jgi:uncharacterized Fe-S cluster-containing radical SAM superfamily protein
MGERRDHERFRSRRACGDGYIFNADPVSRCLHAANCAWLRNASVPPAKWWFATRQAARAWMWARYADRAHECPTCLG